MELSIVGKPLVRLDARDKVTGAALYGVHMEQPGMLHAHLLRSPHPHARLLRVDTSRAEALPGVRAVLCRNDLLGNDRFVPYYGPAFRDQPVVALDKVRYVGDIVAAVAALDPATAQEAVELIAVEYEDLPPVLDVQEAMQPGGPLVHEAITSPQVFADLADLRPVPGTNICNHFHLDWGDLEQGFAAADEVFEDVFTSPATYHCPLEPHVAVAAFDGQGRLTVQTSSQSPNFVRTQLSEILKMPAAKVRVVVPYLGGGYGAKVYMKMEPLAALLAWKAGAPVRVALSMEESFLTITKHPTRFRLKTGVKRDGTLVARECEVIWDTGAYADIGPRVSIKSGYTSPGPYRIPNVRIDSYCVYTNKPPAGAFRGFGISQIVWGYESQLDIIAQRLGLDPVAIRLKNLLREGDRYVTGQRMESIGVAEALRKVAAAVGWQGPQKEKTQGPKARGKGFACMIKAVVTPSVSDTIVKLNEDGSANVFTSTVEMGQGSDTVLAQIAAEALGLPISQVAVTHSDTDVTPFDMITAGSRSTFHMGKAVQQAAEEVKGQLVAIAAEMLEASPQDLVAHDGRVSVRGTERGVSFQALMQRRFGMKGGTLVGSGSVKTRAAFHTPEGELHHQTAFWFVGAGAAEVEVDRETGQVRLLRYATAVDVGKAINPMNCEQQLEGAAVTGIGQALSEELVLAEGEVVNPTFMDYRIPSIEDIPEEMISEVVEVPHPEGPYGAKGVGEMGTIPVAPAIANAIAAACGVRIKELPITPERVLAALREERGEP